MKILDWRSRFEKLVTSLWRGQACEPSVGPVGRAWAALHDRIVAPRVSARPATAGQSLVVSVGNLALGGTGKTPVVIALAKDLAALGHTGVVLTRGYRSKLAGPVVVHPDNDQAGDEARLLAQELTPLGWSVVQSRVRAAGMGHILGSENPPEVVLLEDGHQTAGVGRDLDVVILDNWRVEATSAGPQVVPLTGAVVPLGPWRESHKGAQRAQVWLLETEAEAPGMGLGGSRVLTFQRRFGLRPVNESAASSESPTHPCLVSGIARPERFEENAQRLLGQAAPLAVRLSDHEPYDRQLANRVRLATGQAGCGSLVTTAKDWVKLAAYWSTDIPAYVIDLTIVWGNGETLSDLVEERFRNP